MVTWQQLEKSFNGKSVFLTGHTGFKGSWLTLILNELGANVTGYSLAPENEINLYQQLNGDNLCNSIIGDIRDSATLEAAIVDTNPDYVIHFAAQSLVIKSYEEPIYTFETNVIGTINVINALKKINKPVNSLIITTDKVYENLEKNIAYKEDERLGGYDPYSNSKACAELATSSFINSFFNPNKYADHKKAITTARSGNVIGGGDWSENRLVPDIARALAANEKVILRNPKSIRPWQHVLEPLAAYLLLVSQLHNDYPRFAQPFNFGPHTTDVLTVEALVKEALNSFGSGSYAIEQNEDNVHEANLLMLDIEKAGRILDWKPKYNSQQAIKQTMDWYKNAPGNEYNYTLQQIKDYFE